MEYDDIRQKIREYNWDDGLSFPKEILENPNCDLALALEIFYLADGYSYLDNSYGITGLTEWKAFISNLFNNILNGMFSKTGNSFECLTGLYEIDEILKNTNSLTVSLSGSGPSVFAVYADLKEAEKAFLLLKEKNIEAYIATPESKGVVIEEK